MRMPKQINIKLSARRWVQVFFTSQESATIYRYNKTKETINGMGLPLFNVKKIDNEWQLNIVREPVTANKIWPQIKEQVAFESLAQQLTQLPS
jgi:hypothetical protein